MTDETPDETMQEPTGKPDPENDSASELFGKMTGRFDRRGFMSTAGKAGVGAMALGTLGAGSAAAQDSSGDPTIPEILNFALTLERLEATYYQNALASSDGVFSESDVERSDVAKYFMRPTLQYSLYQQFEDVRDHEVYHVTALEGVLDQLGAEVTAAEPADFTLPDGVYDSVQSFVAFAAVVENVGVSAYAGAAPALAKAELATVDGDLSQLAITPTALGIHSIEARHASILRTLDLKRAWPFGTDENVAETAIDDPRTMEEVLAIAGEYIQG